MEETLAEFPYDPNLDHKKIDKDGNITWVLAAKKQNEFLQDAPRTSNLPSLPSTPSFNTSYSTPMGKREWGAKGRFRRPLTASGFLGI